MKRRLPPYPDQTAPRGFTLLELLITISIIGILMALILPAISGARRNVQESAVAAEITQLDQAIASFKSRFGVEPPSSLLIPASSAGWTAEDRQRVLRVWDQFDFATCGGLGYAGTAIHLNGAECLVFFLGGVNSPGPSGVASLIGFSKNPRTPWASGGGNRDVPFYDKFLPDRLVDVDGDGAPEFLDSLPGQAVPYLYLSSQGKSYDISNSVTPDQFDVFTDPPATIALPLSRNMSFVYLQANGSTPQRASSFQIVSPGFDGAYGYGGIYLDGAQLVNIDLNSDGDELDIIDATPANGRVDPIDGFEARGFEADNITNFTGGEMKK